MRFAPSLFAFGLVALATPALGQPPSPEPEPMPPAAVEPASSTTVQEVVVTAAPYAVSLDSVTTSINVVTRAQLDTAPPTGLGDVLNGLPGLRSSFHGPGASRPIIRGLSGPRVLVLANGVGLVDASTLSPDHAVAAEPSESSRIEVLRGPSTLAYGGSGIGGVVNVIDDRIPSRGEESGVSGRLGGSISSVDDGRAVSAGVRWGVGSFAFDIDGASRRSEDYAVPVRPVSDRLAAQGLTPANDRTVRNTALELDAYGFGGSYIAEWGYVRASVRRDDTTYGVPFPQVIVGAGEEDPERIAIHLQQTRYDVRGETRLSGWLERARLSIGYAEYEHAEVVAGEGVGTRFLSSGGEGRLELTQRERDGWQGAFGAQYLDRSFEAIGDEAFVPPTQTREGGVFALQRLDRDSWGVEGGLRLDHNIREADLAGRVASDTAAAFGLDWGAAPASRDYTNVSASAAVFIRPRSGLFLSLSVSSNARAPDATELYADGPHEGTRAFETGDPTLDSERVTSAEITVRYTGDRGRAEAHAYLARYRGFIEETPTGLVEDDLPVFRFVATDGTFHGFEVEGSWDLWRDGERALALQGVADYVRGDLDTGAPARIPPWSLTARLTYASPRLEGRVEARYVADQERVASFELPTDGYTMVNAFVGVRPFADRSIRLFLDARNLTDTEAREHASFLKDIAPLPGRNIRAGVAWSF